METSDVRKQVLQAIDRAHRAAAERRKRNAGARESFEGFLAQVATPLVRQIAESLKAAGYPFIISTPADRVRLQSERHGDDYVELSLDTHGPLPQVVLTVQRQKGRESVLREAPVKPDAVPDAVSEGELLKALLDVLEPFLER